MMIEALASKQKVVLCELKEIQLLVAAATTVWYFLFVRKKSCDCLGMFEHSYMTQLFFKLGRDFCLLTNITRCIKNSTSKIAKK